MSQSRAELWRALGSLAEAAASERSEAARALGLSDSPQNLEHTEVLLMEVHPYASVYLGAEGMLGGEAGDRVAGFWRALGLTPPSEPDHLASLCGLYAALLDEEADPDSSRSESIKHVKRSLLGEHMLPWIPMFAHKVSQVAQGPLATWSELLLEALSDEAKQIEIPDRLPLHLREAPSGLGPGLGDGTTSDGTTSDGTTSDGNQLSNAKELTAQLLAPIRTGMVLARSDLTQIARHLGLGLRLGERRFTLLTLLEQDPVSVLDWLAQQASDWTVFNSNTPKELGPSGAFFAARSQSCKSFLVEASQQAQLAVGQSL